MPSSDADILQEALKRFQLAAEADSTWREKSLDDLEFSTGKQWPMDIQTQRERDGRPCLTMDQVQQAIRQVCNEYRQQRPAVQINPIGDEADVDTAEILQGAVRHVEVNSDAEIAYDNAHEGVVRTGFGSWRLLNDYADDESDEQEIFIAPIRNQFTVYWQPGVPQEKAKWAFIIEDVPLDTYKSDYDTSTLSLNNFQGTGNSPPEWLTKEYVRVAEYFVIEEVEQRTKRRPRKQVKWYKLNAVEIMDKRDLPGTSIPILTAYGDDIDVNGKRHVAGLVRNMKDPQRQYNYMNSAATEAIALAPKAPHIVVEGQLAGYEKQWEQANVRNFAVLTYKAVDVQGKPAPPPQRSTVEPPIQAITMMIRQASLDIKGGSGVYDPSLGQRKGDESGKAIEKLQTQGDVATLNYSDNVARTMRRNGRLLLEWMRAIYDTPRIQRIIRPDGTITQVVTHNGPDQADAAQKMLTAKITKIYDIGVGRYDVSVSVGPSYQSKRQEAVATQINLLKVLPPNIAPNVLDLVVRNMDIPQSKEIADRLKKLLPPQLQDGDDSDPQTQISKLQAQLQAMTQQHELLTKVTNEQADVIKTKKVEADGKVQIVAAQEASAQVIAKMQLDAKVAIAEIESKAQDVSERKQWVVDIWKELHGSSADRALSAQEHQQKLEQGQQQQQGDQQAQEADQGHEADMQQQQQGHDQEMAATAPQNGNGG